VSDRLAGWLGLVGTSQPISSVPIPGDILKSLGDIQNPPGHNLEQAAVADCPSSSYQEAHLNPERTALLCMHFIFFKNLKSTNLWVFRPPAPHPPKKVTKTYLSLAGQRCTE